LFLPHLGNRYLHDNQLTSLEVGAFDKNTALNWLYVDTKQKGFRDEARKGQSQDQSSWETAAAWLSMRRGHAPAREVASGGGLAELKPCHFPMTAWERWER